MDSQWLGGGREERGSEQGKEGDKEEAVPAAAIRGSDGGGGVAGSRRNGRFLREAAYLVLASRFLSFCLVFLVFFFPLPSSLLVSRDVREILWWPVPLNRRGCPCLRGGEEGETNLRWMRDAWRHEGRLMGVRSKREEEKPRGLGIALSSILICSSLSPLLCSAIGILLSAAYSWLGFHLGFTGGCLVATN